MHAARIDTRAAKRRRGRIRLGGVAVAAVAAVALFAVGLPSGGGGGVAPHVDESLAGVLRTASINAAGQPALPIPGPGHYYHYTDTELGYISELNGAQEGCVTSCPPLPSDWGVKAWARSAMWISADGTALRTTSFGKPVIRNAQVRADLAAGRYAGASLSRPMGPAAATYFPAGAASGWSFGGMTLKQVYALPSDPAKLERIVRERAQGTKNPLNEEMFTVVGDIMRAAPLRPEVRAGLFTVLSGLDGVQLVGHVHDPLGRPGIEVKMGGEELIFDAHTAQLLSEGAGGYSAWTVVKSRPHIPADAYPVDKAKLAAKS